MLDELEEGNFKKSPFIKYTSASSNPLDQIRKF